MNTKEQFKEKLFAWYEHHKRNLPWRHTKDPYKIWLSEIILQQTRVAQGLPYYRKFVEAFPTITDMAMASEQEVLRLWQGLGYYSRARNMHQTAMQIFKEKNGDFPNTYDDLLKLKGIGSYTAAAIASFAFEEKVAVLDGNVFRVLARIFGIDTDIVSSQAKKIFGKVANDLIDEEHPDIFNQALMEFGALQCQPVSPDCLLCPFNDVCIACLSGRQKELPVKTKKLKVKKRYFHYLIFQFEDKIAMKCRTIKDIWQGLYDFYLTESSDFQDLEVVLPTGLQTILLKNMTEKMDETFTHQLTHQKIFTRFWKIRVTEKEVEILKKDYQMLFYTLPEVENLPKPVLITNFLKQYEKDL
jgi:A/G-specific adenine glycosylase